MAVDSRYQALKLSGKGAKFSHSNGNQIFINFHEFLQW